MQEAPLCRKPGFGEDVALMDVLSSRVFFSRPNEPLRVSLGPGRLLAGGAILLAARFCLAFFEGHQASAAQ